MATKFCDPSAAGSNNGTSWEDAYTSFQAAIDACGAGDEVWVKARTITLVAGIDYDNTNTPLIYGGFDVGLTGTSGSVAGRTAGSRTTLDGLSSVQGWLTRSCTLDGFYFYRSTNNYGGLQLDYASATWTLRNCRFEKLIDSWRGGAIRLSSGTLNIDQCDFYDNGTRLCDYGSAICMINGTLNITNTTFTGHSALYSGVCLYQYTGTMTVTDCLFNDNRTVASTYGEGGCCYHHTGSNITYTRCRILNTTCAIGGYNWGGGVGFNGTASAKMINCVVANNKNADYGGGVLVSGCTAYFANCTISGNTCVSGGGGLRNRSGGIIYVYNSILYGNYRGVTADEISHAGTAITVQYSDVKGGYTGTGNVDVDPKFRGAGPHPFDLGQVSNVVDSGNAGATNYPTTDMLGRARVDYPGHTGTGAGSPAYSDMGAYEMQYAPVYAPRKMWVNVAGTWKQVYIASSNVAGTWKPATKAETNVAGTWKYS
jgi:hypothetical protein